MSDDNNTCHICFYQYGGCFNLRKQITLSCNHTLCHKCYNQIVQRSVNCSSETFKPDDVNIPCCPFCREPFVA
jgi:hypothetical protein